MTRRPKVLVFDSGLGGLTVFREVARARPDLETIYVADDAGFPYGRWAEPDLVERVVTILAGLIAETSPDTVVIACNTASTLVLPALRSRFPDIPFVGTVPAIKPAAAGSASKLISVLATPGTVARDYTRALIESFAADCQVTLVGSARLASIAETAMTGFAVADADILTEIRPCFVEQDGRRTDAIVLACTHYPLLVEHFDRLAPWPVRWIDPAPAIARRLDSVLKERGFALEPANNTTPKAADRVVFTTGRVPDDSLTDTLLWAGLRPLKATPVPAKLP